MFLTRQDKRRSGTVTSNSGSFPNKSSGFSELVEQIQLHNPDPLCMRVFDSERTKRILYVT